MGTITLLIKISHYHLHRQIYNILLLFLQYIPLKVNFEYVLPFLYSIQKKQIMYCNYYDEKKIILNMPKQWL